MTKQERTIPLEIMPEKKDKDGVPVYDFTFEDVVGLCAQLCVRLLNALDLIAMEQAPRGLNHH